MTALEFRDYILTQMKAEDALLKLLEGPLGQYEKLKFDSAGEPVHPLIIMSMAAMDMGWDFVIEKNQPNIRGLVVGTKEYFEEMNTKPKDVQKN